MFGFLKRFFHVETTTTKFFFSENYRQAVDLTERTSPEQAAAIREPLHSVNRRWENLLKGMVERQKQLEHALLHLGQFQHALNELLVWINKTDSTLDQLKPVSCYHFRKSCCWLNF